MLRVFKDELLGQTNTVVRSTGRLGAQLLKKKQRLLSGRPL